MVLALQTLVTRKFDVFDPVVITVGSFHAGTTDNVIPDQAKFLATARSYSAASGPEHLGDRLYRELRLGRVVDGDRVLGRVFDVGGQPVRVGDVPDQPRHQVRQRGPGRGAVGAGGGHGLR